MDNENDLDWFLDEKDSYSDYQTYVQSREWQIKASSAKRLAYYKCENCGAKPDVSSDLHVHHRHYESLFHERRQDIQVLCASCHRKAHRL